MAGEKAHRSEVNIDGQRLASIYATALLGTSEPKGTSESLLAELDHLVDEVLQRHPAMEQLLGSPRVGIGEKMDLLDRVFGGRVSDELLTFLKVVNRHGRLNCLRAIRGAFRRALNNARGIVPVEVTTATPLDGASRAKIADQLRASLGREVELNNRIRPEIIGGLVVRVGDTVFDGSIANRLARTKHEVLSQTIQRLRESIDRFAVSG